MSARKCGNKPITNYDPIYGVARLAADDFVNRVYPVEGLDLLLWESELRCYPKR